MTTTFAVHLFDRADCGTLIRGGTVVFSEAARAIACAQALADDVEGVCVVIRATDRDSGTTCLVRLLFSCGDVEDIEALRPTVH